MGTPPSTDAELAENAATEVETEDSQQKTDTEDIMSNAEEVSSEEE